MKKALTVMSLFLSLSVFAQSEPSVEDGDYPIETEQAEDIIYLENTDIRELALVVEHYFEGNAESVVVPEVSGDYKPVKSAAYNGALGKAEFTIELEDGEKLEFRNVKLQLNKAGRGGYGEYSLIAVCIGADCGKVFATVFVREDGRFIYNWPLAFKRDESGKYVRALQRPGAVYEEPEDTAELPEPPQVKVAKLLAEKAAEHEEGVLQLIRSRMVENDSTYSGLFFLGLTKPAVQVEFEAEEGKLQLSAEANFFDLYKKQDGKRDMSFSGALGKEAIVLSDAGAETNLEVIPIEGTDLIAFVFDQKSYKSLLPGVNRGMSAFVCSILVENGATYHACEMMPSSSVLGTIALEGKLNGPIYVKDGLILDKLEE